MANEEKLGWDYTELASSYDKRADYCDLAIDALLEKTKTLPGKPVIEIGAGTGKLTGKLLDRGLAVTAIEPNDAMMGFGRKNTQGREVTWFKARAEATGMRDSSAHLAVFGSSFNVTDRQAALKEVARILRPGGWFACMWNHRVLDDPLQAAMEGVIKKFLPEYSYGTRREDQTKIIADSGLFHPALTIEETQIHQIPALDFMDAWRSHATLERQAGEKFHKIIEAMEGLMPDASHVAVPYTTRIWCAELLG